jgi:hypothetical protein
VFELLFDRRHGVLMSRFHGTYVAADIAVRDNAAERFVARHGPARGIMDFTAVEAVDVPMDYIVERAHSAPALPGQARVIVAPHEPAYSLNRVIAAHQLYSRRVEPLLVGTLDDAYRALGIDEPAFERVEADEATRLEVMAFDALAGIERTRLAAGDDRQDMRHKMLRLLDTVIATKGSLGQTPTVSTITLSDVLNTLLRRTKVSEADLSARCARCGHRTSLAACRIEAGRETTYACPGCGKKMLTLAAAGDSSGTVHGYTLGGFRLRTAVDIECRGGILPKSLTTIRSG